MSKATEFKRLIQAARDAAEAMLIEGWCVGNGSQHLSLLTAAADAENSLKTSITKGSCKVMTDEEFDKRLKRIAELAHAQKVGPYGPQSDAVAALELIETLALLLIENAEARSATAP